MDMIIFEIALLFVILLLLGTNVIILCHYIAKVYRYLRTYKNNIRNLLRAYESEWYPKEENENEIQTFENIDSEYEIRFQYLEKKNVELEKKIRKIEEKIKKLEEYHPANVDYAYNREDKRNVYTTSNVSDDRSIKLKITDPAVENIKLLPSIGFTKKVGPKINKNNYSIENIMFEKLSYGKLCVVREEHNKIYVEPESNIIVEKIYQEYGLNACFNVNIEILAGHQYKIVNVKKQCEMKVIDNNCYQVLNKGELEIMELNN